MAGEQGLPKIPNLQVAELKFRVQQNPNEHQDLKTDILKLIEQDDMLPFYQLTCKDLGWKLDDSFAKKMKAKNQAELEVLDKKISDTEANLGESDIRDAYLAKAEYLCKIGDKEACLSLFRTILDKSLALGQKLDVVFYCIRLGLFYMDTDLVQRNLEKAKGLVEKGGDWDRRNRLKVYEGVFHMYNRDFKSAVNLFLDAVSTFTSTEIMSYDEFVRYTVYMAMVTLPRVEIKSKVIDNDEIQQRLNCSLPDAKKYLTSLYESDYAGFFESLFEVEAFMKLDRYLYKHYRFYIKEVRIIAYSQILQSYRSVTLQYIADAFNVSVPFIDKELARFIAANRLPCKINKVRGIVETTRPDSKNYQYQQLIKQGDHLLNKIQKLSRVINL